MPGDSGDTPCPFPFFVSFSTHFTKTHMPHLSFQGNWGRDEAFCIIRLVNLIQVFHPQLGRRINITLAQLINCNPTRIKRFKELKIYRDCLASLEDVDIAPPDPLDSIQSSDLLVTFSAGDEHCDDPISARISDLYKEISGLSALFKDHNESPISVNIDSPKPVVFYPYPCLFCERSFSTKIGLGQHKKSQHLNEYLLEIEHKYRNPKRVH